MRKQIYKSIKINEHKEYLELLEHFQKRCKYIELIINDNEDIKLINSFKNEIVSIKNVNSWWNMGNKELCDFKLYRFDANEQIFKALKKFDTFVYIDEIGNDSHTRLSDFGSNDIAFLDSKENVLLRTDIKNGYIDILV